MPQQEVDLRNQRLKRAHDCSLKKAYLPKHIQDQQTPYHFYMEVGCQIISCGDGTKALPCNQAAEDGGFEWGLQYQADSIAS